MIKKMIGRWIVYGPTHFIQCLGGYICIFLASLPFSAEENVVE
jgi:hypothetical protein